ncbi:hypothetical protein GG344DRAFT_84055 [Lentinula edodes]|nr:hypothetical protein GG344DRAFT_84055 [Lentinula edodes]
MAPFSKPETVLKQAEGFVSVGQTHPALQSLSEMFSSKHFCRSVFVEAFSKYPGHGFGAYLDTVHGTLRGIEEGKDSERGADAIAQNTNGRLHRERPPHL